MEPHPPQPRTAFSGRDLWLLLRTETSLIWLSTTALILSTLFLQCESAIWRHTLYLVCVRALGKLAGLAVFWFAVMVQCRHQYLCISVWFYPWYPQRNSSKHLLSFWKLHSELWFLKNTLAFCCPLISSSTVTDSPSSLCLSKNDYDEQTESETDDSCQ